MTSAADFARDFAGAPRSYGAIPFWFWNDDLDEAELLRQLRALAAGGCAGVVIHPRTGLSARIGYLTPTYFHLVRRVVDECRSLGLQVVLYDEGSYPSGAAGGQVVAANPAHAARALILKNHPVTGPWTGYLRVADGRSLEARPVCAVLARTDGDAVDPTSLQLLPMDDRGLVRVAVDAGSWAVLGCLDVPSGGRIRGTLAHEDDGMATAPAAGDLLNPDAVASFLRLTHDRYAAALGGHLGTAVVALFTDEPSVLGRGSRRGAWPFTAGFDAWLATRLGRTVDDLHAWLPALWLDYGPATGAFRHEVERAVHARLDETFYRAQADWCAAHGLALTGHPAESNDLTGLARFHWPGQDAVWRWVAPGDGTRIEGAHSVSARAASSAARLAGRARNATELFGAYGWRLSLDEAKWLIDWHLARGTDLFFPHAAFYSVRGGRAFESEPDVALQNPWWPHFQGLLAYVRRMSWLGVTATPVCQIAVAGVGHALPWASARTLAEAQSDFLYVDLDTLARAETVPGAPTGGEAIPALRLGEACVRAVVVEVPDGVTLPPAARERLAAFARAGGTVVDAPLDAPALARLRALTATGGGVDVRVDPPALDLRARHVRRDGLDVYAFFNEGEAEIAGWLHLAAVGAAALVDPLRDPNTGTPPAPAARGEDGAIWLRLPRRECRLVVVAPEGDGDPPPATPEGDGDPSQAAPEGGGAGPTSAAPDLPRLTHPIGAWQVTEADGQPVPVLDGLGDWCRVPALERFAGTLRYAAAIDLDRVPTGPVVLDLGTVGEAAAVTVNGHPVGEAMWAPYVVRVPAAIWRAGANRLDVAVTNSAANRYEGAMRPSGLLGPVTLRRHGLE